MLIKVPILQIWAKRQYIKCPRTVLASDSYRGQLAQQTYKPLTNAETNWQYKVKTGYVLRANNCNFAAQ